MTTRVVSLVLVVGGLVGVLGAPGTPSAQPPEYGRFESPEFEPEPCTLESAEPAAGVPHGSSPQTLATAKHGLAIGAPERAASASAACAVRYRRERFATDLATSAAPLSVGRRPAHSLPSWRSPGHLRVGGSSTKDDDSTIA